MRVETHSAQDTQALAASRAPVLPAGTWIRLEGDLGAGKTTFTQGLGKALGIARAIKSPTYTIVKEYDLEGQPAPRLIHIDAYRLEEGGADTVDLASYRQQGDLVLVEWAQFIETELPTAYLDLALSYGQEGDDRVLTIQWVGGQEPEWLSQWSKEVSDHAR